MSAEEETKLRRHQKALQWASLHADHVGMPVALMSYELGAEHEAEHIMRTQAQKLTVDRGGEQDHLRGEPMSGEHLVIPSDYPGEPALHLYRHEDGDVGVAVAEGDRWPGFGAMTLSATRGRDTKAWQAFAGLFLSTTPSDVPGEHEAELVTAGILGTIVREGIDSGAVWSDEGSCLCLSDGTTVSATSSPGPGISWIGGSKLHSTHGSPDEADTENPYEGWIGSELVRAGMDVLTKELGGTVLPGPDIKTPPTDALLPFGARWGASLHNEVVWEDYRGRLCTCHTEEETLVSRRQVEDGVWCPISPPIPMAMAVLAKAAEG